MGKLVRGVVQRPVPLPLHHSALCPPHRPLLSTQVPSSDAYKTLVTSTGRALQGFLNSNIQLSKSVISKLVEEQGIEI